MKTDSPQNSPASQHLRLLKQHMQARKKQASERAETLRLLELITRGFAEKGLKVPPPPTWSDKSPRIPKHK